MNIVSMLPLLLILAAIVTRADVLYGQSIPMLSLPPIASDRATVSAVQRRDGQLLVRTGEG